MDRLHSRRVFLGAGASVVLASLADPVQAAAPALHPQAHATLDDLMAGNARFAADKATCPPLTARRLELARGQSPRAIIVSCSDSRVPVEIVFDQQPGAIFGVRLAGNFVDDNGLGSIEYSVAVLKSALILVLGHTECGAVKATVDFVKAGTRQPSHIQNLVDAIAPAAREARSRSGDWVANATLQNVKDTVSALASRSEIVGKAVADKTLSVAGGVYDLHSGRVTIVA